MTWSTRTSGSYAKFWNLKVFNIAGTNLSNLKSGWVCAGGGGDPPLVHTIYSVRTTGYFQKNETGACCERCWNGSSAIRPIVGSLYLA